MIGAPQVTARNFAQYDRDFGYSGMPLPVGPFTTPTILAVTANLAYVCRFICSRNVPMTIPAFVVTTLSAGNVDVGFYDSTLTTKLASTGPTAGLLSSTGVKVPSLSYTFSPGTVYYSAMVFDSTPSILGVGFGNANAPLLFGTAVPAVRGGSCVLGTNTLPASLGAVTGLANVAAPLALRES